MRQYLPAARGVAVRFVPKLPQIRYRASSTIIVRALPFDDGIRLTGKLLTLFVFFAASLNYLHYKNIREKVEKIKQEDKDNNPKV